MKYLKLFETTSEYETYINGSDKVLPNVSFCEDERGVHYTPTPPPLCRLTLDDDSIVNIEGSGELTQSMIESYQTRIINAEIGETCTSIGNNAFSHCSGLTSVTIGLGVISIGSEAFYQCSVLTSVTIPDSVTSIGNGAFEDCRGLTSVTIGSGVTSIGEWAFQYCRGLTSVTIPDNVTSIGRFAFEECSELTSVTIGSGVTSIGDEAFYNCSSLTNIVSNATTAPTIGDDAFEYIADNGTLYVPIGSSGYDAWMEKLPESWTKVEQ